MCGKILKADRYTNHASSKSLGEFMGTGRLLDDTILSILNDWVGLTTSAAENAVAMILQNSSEYLSEEQQKAVSDFHALYFADGDLAANKQAMNREVDALFDAIQAEVAAGGDFKSLNSIAESDDAKQERLSLSGVQKQLETIIQLETGLREKLVPVLTSMQFEDALKQRLGRMVDAWKASLEAPPATQDDIQVLGERIAKKLGSKAEREAFYPKILKRPAPKDLVDEITLFDALV
jgi:hypothetical protein